MNFFFEHATATIVAAWEIYHGASDSIELESLNEREGDATQEKHVYLAERPAVVTTLQRQAVHPARGA
jgi:hypothetical protein